MTTWNYGWEALYFITICTHNRLHYFGKINKGSMLLSEIGNIVDIEWQKTVEMRPDMNLDISTYVIMPNHFHAIVGIGQNKYNSRLVSDNGSRDAMHCVSTENNHENQFGPQSKNLASIVRGFKSAVTKQAKLIDASFAWQARFHDHIIRDHAELIRINNYIEQNPIKWDSDMFYQTP